MEGGTPNCGAWSPKFRAFCAGALTCTFEGPGLHKHHQNSTRRHTMRDKKSEERNVGRSSGGGSCGWGPVEGGPNQQPHHQHENHNNKHDNTQPLDTNNTHQQHTSTTQTRKKNTQQRKPTHTKTNHHTTHENGLAKNGLAKIGLNLRPPPPPNLIGYGRLWPIQFWPSIFGQSIFGQSICVCCIVLWEVLGGLLLVWVVVLFRVVCFPLA